MERPSFALKTTPRRLPRQFSLRALLVLTTLVALACSLMAVPLRTYERQEAAITELRQGGCEFVENRWPMPAWSPSTWVIKLLGNRYPANVFAMEVYEYGDWDWFIANLVNLPELAHLNLRRCHVTDGMIRSLGCLRSLEMLDLEGTALSEAALPDLAALPNVRFLNLAHTRIRGSSLTSHPGLSRLHGMTLDGTQVADGGAALIKHLIALHAMEVFDASDEQLACLLDANGLVVLIGHLCRTTPQFLGKFVPPCRTPRCITKICDNVRPHLFRPEVLGSCLRAARGARRTCGFAGALPGH